MSLKKPFIVIFFKEDTGKEPVLVWLKKLEKHEREKIGEDLQTLQYKWPTGMPLVKSFGKGLWELRTTLKNRITRIMFVVHNQHIILLHGFIKKTEKTPLKEIEIAQTRLKKLGYYKRSNDYDA